MTFGTLFYRHEKAEKVAQLPRKTCSPIAISDITKEMEKEIFTKIEDLMFDTVTGEKN